MVPVIAANGASFQGAFHYYCHDKQGRTTARVAWTQTVNMLTNCAAKAWKVMAYTAKNQDRLKEVSGRKATGRKLKKPVFAYSLSWAPEQQPDQAEMLATAMQSLDELGLTEHQAILVAHSDRPHAHVHVIVNTVHPRTGLVAKLAYSKRRLSEFALRYEQKGGKIYCKRRAENRRLRQDGRFTKYADASIAEAWAESRDGQSFAALLEARGYQLAHGRARLVVVDPFGKAINPVRHLGGANAREFEARLASLDLTTLPGVEEVITRSRRTNGAAHGGDAHRDSQKTEFPEDRSSVGQGDDRPVLDLDSGVETLERNARLFYAQNLAARRATLLSSCAESGGRGFWQRIVDLFTGRKKRLLLEIKRIESAIEQLMGQMEEPGDAIPRITSAASFERPDPDRKPWGNAGSISPKIRISTVLNAASGSPDSVIPDVGAPALHPKRPGLPNTPRAG